MRITVAICTRNRAAQLGRVLESATQLRVPVGLAWELVLVDNGSTDNTIEVANAFADRLPLRSVREDIPGLSHARNRAVSNAKGEYICWTDDDVVIDPDWLASYAEAFDRHPDAAFFGGVIEPVLEGETPKWFEEGRASLNHLLAERNFGPQVVTLDPVEMRMPYGANFAVRAREQREHQYDVTLGVGPGMRRLGEESDVLHRIYADGGTGFWVPGSRVRHMIPESRQTVAYVRIYNESAGETWAHLGGRHTRLEPETLTKSRLILGAPAWLWREKIVHTVLYAVTRLTVSSNQWIAHLTKISFCSGAITYLRR